MNKSKRKSATVFSRDEIGVEQLQSLKEKLADGDLNEKEFVSLFREIIDASLSETQLTELFQKIDANSDGTVDWDELTNYMFLSGSDNSAEFIGDDCNAYYETYQPDKLGEGATSEATGAGGVANSGASASGSVSGLGSSSSDGSSTARSATHHKDLVTRVLRLEKPSLYLTASKDGSVRTWNVHTLQLQSVITTGKDWLTDCCVMKRSNRLAVTSMNRTLGIYDLGSNALIGEITEYSSRKAIPLCVEYVEKPADDREALVIGDDTGGITVMTCSDLWMACDGRSTGPATSGSSSSSGTTSSSSGGGAMGVSLETHGFSSRTKFKKHTDWVTRVKWVHDMRAIVATSLDTNISIIDVDRMVVKFEYNRHKKGVFDLVWCASTRLIASCGMERDISIWNPYSSQRAVATLRGHTSSVVQVVSDDDNYQILSVASDNTFKVWDVRNHRCLQTWVDRAKSTGGAEHRIAALLFDGKQPPCLLSATTHLTRWPFKVQDADGDPGSGGGDGGASAAEKPMTLASYNAVFHQVVTAEISAASVVKTWSAETGDEICSFTNAHGQSPVTAIAFDYPGRRLLTGSHDGAVIKMWNFSNGALVKQFHKQQRSDTAMTGGVASTSVSSSAAGMSGSGGATTSLPLADDLSFLGLDGDDGDGETDTATKKSGANKKPTAATATTQFTLPTSPRKRNKVRDIMLLPPAFGVDIEGRKNPQTLSAYTELPSPTRTQLHAKGDKATGRLQSTYSPRRGTSNQADAHPQDTEPASPSARRSSDSTSTAATPALAAATYCEKEVTSILDIERNLRVGMGDYICQRFVCCVGWDRSVFVWADKNDESEALPTHVLPPPSTQQSSTTKCHTMDVLALVYIPPAYVATAGLDGTILLWSINSGDFLSRVYQSSGSIDTMVYAQKIEMLFAAGETGELICVDRSMTPRAVIPLEHPHREAVTAIRCDRTNTHLVTGDVAGYLKVWDLSISPDHAGLVLDVCCLWRVPTGGSASSARVLALDFVEHVRVSEPFLLVSSGNGDVTLWTLDGVQVGCFGRHRTWQLGRPTTYLATTSECIWPETSGLSTPELNRERVSHPSAVLAATQTRPELIDCFSIAALRGSETVRDSFLLEDLMPKPGEVWVCVSGHRSTRAAAMGAKKAGGGVGGGGGGGETIEWIAATNDRRSSSMRGGGGERGGESSLPLPTVMPTLLRPVSMSSSHRSSFVDIVGAAAMRETLSSLPFLQQRLAEIASDVTDLITVVKVTRGEISCWDGHSHRPPVLKVLEMSEFVRRAGWVKQPLLTQYIGRVFADDATHFQVTGISLVAVDSNKPDRKVFSLIDTHGQDHGVRPLSEAVSTARVKVQAQLEQRRLQQVTGDASASRPAQTPRKRLTAMPTASTLPIESNASSKTADENGGSALSIESVSPGPPTSAMTLTTSVTAAHVLPLIKPKERRSMGGMLPKRSSVRMRHDQSVDFRRIHVPQDMPKNFRAALNQCMQAIHGGGGQSTYAAATQASSRSGRSSLRFDGVLPE